jgi:Inositol monophosphatase family
MLDYGTVWADIVRAVLPELSRYRRSLSAVVKNIKVDGTWLTDADLALEDLIIDIVRAHDPGAAFIGEERGRIQPTSADHQRVWVVDPIDSAGCSPSRQPPRRTESPQDQLQSKTPGRFTSRRSECWASYPDQLEAAPRCAAWR